MDPQLVSYVHEQLAAGYSEEQISYVLAQQGYPDSLIRAAFHAANNDAGIHQSKKILKAYVRQAHKKGESDYEIEQELENQGYEEQDIKQALAPEHHSKALFIFPLLAIIVLVAGFFFISADSTPPPVFINPDEPLRWGEVSTQVLEMASTNPHGAVGICESLIERDRTRCISAVILESSPPSLCRSLPYDDLRDNCFLQLIQRGNTEFCSELVTTHAQQVCRGLPPNALEQA